jgi:hypothetical protein
MTFVRRLRFFHQESRCLTLEPLPARNANPSRKPDATRKPNPNYPDSHRDV